MINNPEFITEKTIEDFHIKKAFTHAHGKGETNNPHSHAISFDLTFRATKAPLPEFDLHIQRKIEKLLNSFFNEKAQENIGELTKAAFIKIENEIGSELRKAHTETNKAAPNIHLQQIKGTLFSSDEPGHSQRTETITTTAADMPLPYGS